MRRQVLILAGGLGMRLRPITEKIPKPLVEIGGKPFLYWQLTWLAGLGYTDVVLAVGYLNEMIVKEFGNGEALGMNIEYSIENEPLGTGGAILNARELLEDEFFVINGDSYLEAPLDEMAADFEEKRFDALVTSFSNQPATPVPNNLKVRNSIVTEYKKGGGIEAGYNAVDSGVYLLAKKLFLARSRDDRFSLEDVLLSLIKDRRWGAYPCAQRFYDIGTTERVKEFEVVLSKRSGNR